MIVGDTEAEETQSQATTETPRHREKTLGISVRA
jgi:hypothetical protein